MAIRVERLVKVPWSVSLPGLLPNPAELERRHDVPDREVHEWLLEHGGADHLETMVKVSVTNLSPEVVIISDLRSEAERHEPYAGARIHCPTAGANRATLLIFDLDQAIPVARHWEEDGGRTLIRRFPLLSRPQRFGRPWPTSRLSRCRAGEASQSGLEPSA